MHSDKVNVRAKLASFSDHWSPKIIAELNGQQVKLAKLLGSFVWHKHNQEDELFYVLSGLLKIEFRDKTIEVAEGECVVVPRGVEHRPIAEREVEVMLFEPASTINTGDNPGQFTRTNLEKI